MGLEIITNKGKEEISKLMKRDGIIYWRGRNDTGKSASRNSLEHITKFVKNSSHTYIVP
jgi:hypothetical protein